MLDQQQQLAPCVKLLQVVPVLIHQASSPQPDVMEQQ